MLLDLEEPLRRFAEAEEGDGKASIDREEEDPLTGEVATASGADSGSIGAGRESRIGRGTEEDEEVEVEEIGDAVAAAFACSYFPFDQGGRGRAALGFEEL